MNYRAAYHPDPFAPAPPWWAWEILEELRAARVERQHRALVAAGWEPHQPGDPAYLGPDPNPKRIAALAESMREYRSLPLPPPGFD